MCEWGHLRLSCSGRAAHWLEPVEKQPSWSWPNCWPVLVGSNTWWLFRVPKFGVVSSVSLQGRMSRLSRLVPPHPLTLYPVCLPQSSQNDPFTMNTRSVTPEYCGWLPPLFRGLLASFPWPRPSLLLWHHFLCTLPFSCSVVATLAPLLYTFLPDEWS